MPKRPAVEGQLDGRVAGAHGGTGTGGHGAGAPPAVDGGDRGDGGDVSAGEHEALAGAEEERVGVGRARDVRASEVGRHHPEAAADERGRHHRRVHQRVREGDATRLLEDRHEEGLVEPHAPVGLGHEQAEDAHRIEAVPHAAVELAGRRIPRGADHRRRALLREEVADRVAERDVVVRQPEPHRGSPRRRSAAMLRWISLVPA